MKPLKKASRLVNEMLSRPSGLGRAKKALSVSLKKPGVRKKFAKFLKPMSKGRGK